MRGRLYYYTEIASVSCFAKGVVHCRASEEDHLMDEYVDLDFDCVVLRKHLRTCEDITDFIAML